MFLIVCTWASRLLIINNLGIHRAVGHCWVENRKQSCRFFLFVGLNSEKPFTLADSRENNVRYVLIALSATAKLNLDPGKETLYRREVWGFAVPPGNNVVFTLLSWFILLLVGKVCGRIRYLKHTCLSLQFNPYGDVPAVMRNSWVFPCARHCTSKVLGLFEEQRK